MKLFDNTIVPILTYGCEVWGYGDLSTFEKVHTDSLKHILGVKKGTPHVMIYGDLGRYPLSIVIKKKIIGFWNELVTNDQNKLSAIMYKLLYSHASVNDVEFKRIDSMKCIFINMQ